MKLNATVCGVGINDADYPLVTHEKIGWKRNTVWKCPIYYRWVGLISRVYGNKRKNAYEDVTVCDDWLLFSNFKVWMEAQIWKDLELDKDVLIQGSREYGPETCAFVPAYINNLAVRPNVKRSKTPLGVVELPSGKYKAAVTKYGLLTNLGVFNTTKEAHKAWQTEKSNYIIEIVSQYSKEECFRTDIADALMRNAWDIRLNATMGIETKFNWE